MSDTTSYTEEELKGMTRVELRRAAIAVLGIDNKECSNTKSQDLIDRIVAEQGGGNGKGKAAGRPAAAAAGRGRGRPAPQDSGKEEPAREEARPAASKGGGGDGAIARIDVLGKTVDENQTELKEMLQQILDTQAETQRQNFQIFGLLTDLYKFTGEPDELDARLTELDEEWDNQGNASQGG